VVRDLIRAGADEARTGRDGGSGSRIEVRCWSTADLGRLEIAVGDDVIGTFRTLGGESDFAVKAQPTVELVGRTLELS
jgi:hypothetical protein